MNGQLGQVHRSGYGYGPPSFDPDVYRSWVGQALASPVFVRVQDGQGAQVEGATTRSALNQALQMLGWRSPVNATNSTPGAPVVLTVGEQQAPQVAAMLGLAPGQLSGGNGGVGQVRCPQGQTYIPGVGCRVALRAAPVVQATVYAGTQVLRTGNTGQSRVNQAWKMIDDANKFFAVAAGQPAPAPKTHLCRLVPSSTGSVTYACGVDVTGLPQSVVNRVINTLWPLAALTELATVAPLRGAPTVSGADGGLGQVCPTGTVIWPDGSKRYINASVAGKIPVCPPGAALSTAANQCRCSCPAGTFWNSRFESCAPSLRGAPDLSGAPSGQLGNPEASIGLSIGIGGLLLFGLAAYGIWRLARG